MKLNIKELLDFFDDRKDSQKGDANALMSILGEDLNASAYKHFRENKVNILEESVVQGFKGGKQLDRWILDKENNILFQCEIKNWASTSIGGKKLSCDGNDEDIKKTVLHYIKNQFEGTKDFSVKAKHPTGVTKVLLKMRIPKEYQNISKVEPLLIYWMPISLNENALEPLSIIPIKSLNLPIETEFLNLNIFSVSLYLHQLYKKGIKVIDLEMPHLEHRMEILNKLQIKY